MTTHYTWIDTPIGALRIAGDESGLREIAFAHRAGEPPADWIEAPEPPDDLLARATTQLREYFAGRRREFDLPLAPETTPFQARVLAELVRVPYGETMSYGELARRLGNPAASRAVGMANGRNPIPIVIPCHRVIGADGKLTGYGGGLEIKRQLLELESRSIGER